MSHVPVLAVVIVSTLIDALVASVILFRAPAGAAARVVGLRRVVNAVSATTLAFLVKFAILAPFGFNGFGAIHLAYIDLVVLTPALGAALLVASRVRFRGQAWCRLTAPAQTAALASLALIIVGIDATWIEPFDLRLETSLAALSTARDGHGTARVAVMTDLQTNRVSEYERNAVERLLAQKPDVILLPGDVFQGTSDDFAATLTDLRDLLKRLEAPGGVYLALGDTDGGGRHLIEEVLPWTHIRLLRNEIVQFSVGDRRFTIGGVELKYDSPPAQDVVQRLEAIEGDGDIRILLAHRPDVALGLRPKSRIDLVVAGHTHGGQIVIPGFGPPMTLSRVPRNVAAGGLHAINENAIYVSRGVGCERGQAPRIRFFCPPEISLLELGNVPPEERR